MDEKTCENPAAFRYTWPGRDEATICATHALSLCRVAEVMGFHLQVIPLTIEELLKRPWPKCTQKEK
jgi:hypothetical protein